MSIDPITAPVSASVIANGRLSSAASMHSSM